MRPIRDEVGLLELAHCVFLHLPSEPTIALCPRDRDRESRSTATSAWARATVCSPHRASSSSTTTPSRRVVDPGGIVGGGGPRRRRASAPPMPSPCGGTARRWPDPRPDAPDAPTDAPPSRGGGLGARPGGVPGGHIAEDHGVGDAGPRAEIVATHDGGRAVARGVQARRSPDRPGRRPVPPRR